MAAISAQLGRTENACAMRLGRMGCDMTIVNARRTNPAHCSVPSAAPSAVPSAVPSAAPSAVPSAVPSAAPLAASSAVPSAVPSAAPSAASSSASSFASASAKSSQVLGGSAAVEKPAVEKPAVEKPAAPNMHHRAFKHDYHQRGIYMLTMLTESRKRCLGSLEGGISDAHIRLSPLGEKVERCIKQITIRHPQVRVLGYQLMPDHLHVVVFVDTDMGSKHLGAVVSGFKSGCNKAFWNETGLLGAGAGADKRLSPLPSLFEQGYHDRILTHEGQLQNMLDYIADNPRRLAVRQAFPDMFHVRQSVKVGRYTFATVGNIAMLDAEQMVAVHVRRRFTEAECRSYMNDCILKARRGAVLISPFISEKEKAVLHVALKEQLPLINIAANGFQQMYKPPRELFDACAEGRLLIISDRPYDPHAQLTRAQCTQLNATAEDLAATLSLPS